MIAKKYIITAKEKCNEEKKKVDPEDYSIKDYSLDYNR